MYEPEPVFHEQWYLETELAMLEAATRFVKPLPGAVIEIGCWEGRSAAVIANACYPEVLIAVDTWEGSLSEHPEHDTVRLARARDVFAVFRANMQHLTRGNFECHRLEANTFLKGWKAPIKFCHIDAAHDYDSVRETIELLLPRLIPGEVLFGHDYQSANAGRDDLNGGVERAVRATLPGWVTRGNNWYYVNMEYH
jgi:predicted O-methyltransferase YrrM